MWKNSLMLPLGVCLKCKVIKTYLFLCAHSMASVCGGCLAMLDAGVPLKGSVAGVAMGLILNTKDCGGDGEPIILSDILGSEDALGDMDFKVNLMLCFCAHSNMMKQCLALQVCKYFLCKSLYIATWRPKKYQCNKSNLLMTAACTLLNQPLSRINNCTMGD